jgi:hypothetical protein
MANEEQRQEIDEQVMALVKTRFGGTTGPRSHIITLTEMGRSPRYSGSFRNAVLVEQTMPLGRFGALTLLFPAMDGFKTLA